MENIWEIHSTFFITNLIKILFFKKKYETLLYTALYTPVEEYNLYLENFGVFFTPVEMLTSIYLNFNQID